MSAVEAYDHTQPPKNETVSPEGREFVDTPPELEARGAEIILFPVSAGVGEVAVGAFAGSNERENPLDPATLAASGIAVHQGSGRDRYFTRRTQTLSAAPHSPEYNMRARELRSRGGPL